MGQGFPVNRSASWRRPAAAALLGLTLFCLVLSASATQRDQDGERLPFTLIDLQRRASAQLRAAKSLTSLLDGGEAGRINREELQDLALQRLKLIKDLSKDIEWDHNVRKLDLMGRGKGENASVAVQTPASTAEARDMASRLTELTRQVNKQVSQIAGDRQSYEVHVDELSQPKIQDLCRHIRKLSDRLEDFFKGN